MKKLKKGVLVIGLVLGVVPLAFADTVTSLTLEMSNGQGAWTNHPGGIWSTNSGDPLTQLGVRHNGVFLNLPVNDMDLGEISIDLSPGMNTFELFGTAQYGGSDYYGLAVYFDNHLAPADMAVYNANGFPFPFKVTPVGTQISGSANGGVFPDIAPGSSICHFADGSTVELESFNVFYSAGIPDVVAWGNIGADKFTDTIALLRLEYKTVPVPSAISLIGTALIGLIGLRKFTRSL